MSLSNQTLTTQEHHSKWLESIRQAIWYRVKFENEEIPSYDALMLHWEKVMLGNAYVASIRQASNDITPYATLWLGC